MADDEVDRAGAEERSADPMTSEEGSNYGPVPMFGYHGSE